MTKRHRKESDLERLQNMGQEERRQHYRLFCSAFVLSRGHRDARRRNACQLIGLRKLWNLPREVARKWLKEVVEDHAMIRQSLATIAA